MNKKFLTPILFVMIILSQQNAFAQIMISKSADMESVDFDGEWSFYLEWKRSSLTSLYYNNDTTIQLRTAHYGNFIYILVDGVSLVKYDKGVDQAIVCFDTDNNKNQVPDPDDYCFGVPLDGKNGFVLQGGSPLEQTNHFKHIQSPEGFIGISGVSDNNDRYTPIPHASYEFRIPTSLIGRSDIYGFYVGVYDSHSNKMYSWPQDIAVDSPLKIPSPSKWGELISPDKSLPEFPWPMFTLVSSLLATVYLTRKFLIMNHS